MRVAPLASPVMVAALLACGATSAPALPQLVLGFGATGASSDGPKSSGASAAASVLWQFGNRLELGPTLFADDLGSRIGRLVDPKDHRDLGAVAETHRYVFGGAWRADIPLLDTARWRAQWGATWGYYRVQDDRVGIVQRSISALGWSTGTGLDRRLGASAAIGVSARYHRLFEERQDHYFSATLDLSWRPPASGSGPPRKATSQNEN